MAFSVSARRRLALGLLLALPLTAGCGAIRDTLITSFPDIKPVITPILGTPKPSPFAIQTGNLKGSVSSGGKPITTAVVTVGSETFPVAAPPETKTALVKSSAEEADDGLATINGLPYYVMHKEPNDTAETPHERRVRKYPACDASTDFHCKYAYLKRGEYLIEDLPEGQAPLRAIAGAQQSPITMVVVRPGLTVGPFDLAVSEASGGTAGVDKNAVKWLGFGGSLITGELNVQEGASGGAPEYIIEPSEVSIRLAAPAGSQGTTIRRYSVSYEFVDELGELQSTGEVDFPVPPKELLPAQSDTTGREEILLLKTNNALVTSKLIPAITNATTGQFTQGSFVVRYRFFKGTEETDVIKDESGGELEATLGVNITKPK